MLLTQNILEKLYCFTFGEININSKDRFLLTSLSERNLGKSNYFQEARQTMLPIYVGLELKAECYLGTQTFIHKVSQKYN